jgi:hypothetical protein
VFARLFDRTGKAATSDFQVNAYTLGAQDLPSIAASASGFVAVWKSSEQDRSGYGVFGQRFAPPMTFDLDRNGAVDPLTDGLLVLRYLFGFRGGTLVNGAVAPGCTRCDAPSIEAYLAALVS